MTEQVASAGDGLGFDSVSENYDRIRPAQFWSERAIEGLLE